MRSLTPPKGVKSQWRVEPLPTGPITVALQLKEIEKGTRLSVTVSGIPADEDWEEDYKRSEVRWQTALDELKALANDST